MKTINLLILLAVLVGVGQTNAATVYPIATNLNLLEISCGIAYGGTNYLVGMEVGANVVGQLVSTNGTLQGSQINVGSNPGFPPNIALAFGPTNYLFAWSDNSVGSGVDMYGQFISRSGAKVGSRFNLLSSIGSHGFQYVKAMASDGTNFLVVWADGYNSVSQTSGSFYGQIVTPSGTLSGSEFLISGQTQNGNSAAVTFGKTNYLVVWQSNAGSTGNTNQAFGEFVSKNGSPGSLFQIGQTSSVDQNPLAVAFDGTNFLAVWSWNPPPETGLTVTNWDLYGRLVSQTGTFPGSELRLVTDPGSQEFPNLAFDGSEYLLGWTDDHWSDSETLDVTNHNIRFQYFDRSGDPVGSEFTNFPTVGTNAPLSSFNGLLFDGTRYAAAATLGTIAFTAGNVSGIPSSEVYGSFIPKSTPPPAPPQLTSLNYTSGQFSLMLNGTAGTNYVIQVSTNLAGNNWIPVSTNTATGGSFNYTDTHATNTSRFYRAMQQ
jgi:hypothetical protein